MADAKNIDYERLFKVLTIRAALVLRSSERCVDMGFDATALALETLELFFESSNGLGWSEKKGSLEKFLCGVLENKINDHRRRDRKLAGSLDDRDWAYSPPSKEPSPEEWTRFKELEEKLYEAVGNDKDLRNLIAATEYTSGGHRVNQELAEILGKSVPEIVNLKRRLMNNSKVRELLIAYGKRQAV